MSDRISANIRRDTAMTNLISTPRRLIRSGTSRTSTAPWGSSIDRDRGGGDACRARRDCGGVGENAGLEPEKVPAALAMADRIRDDLGHDAARGEALAAVVNRIELSPIRLRVILTAGALVPA